MQGLLGRVCNDSSTGRCLLRGLYPLRPLWGCLAQPMHRPGMWDQVICECGAQVLQDLLGQACMHSSAEHCLLRQLWESLAQLLQTSGVSGQDISSLR